MAEREAQTLALQGDPKRQAVPALHGYLYQIWHSVHAWLDLTDEDFLFLEGAEDFDIVNPEQATAVQVKATSANITLHSTAVTEAICHYWDLQRKHPDKKIFFRFLTRSGIGIEQGQPFGSGVAGLEVWQRCAREPAAVEQLRNFFLTSATQKIPADLRIFLSGAETQQVLDRLISPLTWETEGEDFGYVEQAIHRKLILHGDKHGIPPEKSASVVNRLLKETFATACRKNQIDRFLDRSLFLRIFEEETTVRLPMHQLEALSQAATTNVGALLGVVGGSPFLAPLPIQADPPPLSVSVAPRERFVAELKTQLTHCGVLFLTGSTGMGKTTLAKLVARSAGGNWHWLNVTNYDPVQLRAILKQLSLFLEKEKTVAQVVIDDIDLAPASARTCEDDLGGLLYTLLQRSGRIILTSQKELPQRLTRRLGLKSQSLWQVTPFNENEIIPFAIQLGCPDTSLAQTWAKVILAHTGGHPQLVHARLIALSDSQWPVVTANDVLTTPSEITLERIEARKFLVEQLREPHLELIYRLSLLTGVFRRDHAIAIGDAPPPVTHPGDAFDHLVGPWVESTGKEYYSLSPLLHRAANDVWPKEKVEELHATIAERFLRCGRLSTAEARSIFFHAWIGHSAESLARITIALLSAPEQVWTSIAPDLSCLIHHAGLNPRQALFPEDVRVNAMLRLLQFRIAAEIDPTIASSVIEVWNQESTPYEPHQAFLAERLILASEALIRLQVEFPAKVLLNFSVELAQIQEEFVKAAQIFSFFTSSQFGLDERTTVDELAVFFLFIGARCQTVEFLNNLLEGLKETPPPIRSRLLSAFQLMEPEARMLIDKVWWREAEQKEPNWSSCIAVFEKAIALATEWQVPAFAVSAARGVAIIYDKYVKDASGALAVLDKLTKSLQEPFPLIEDQRASILFGQGQYEESLAIWEKLLPQWNPPPKHRDFDRVFASRYAGIAAARIGEWDKASRFFLEGHQYAQSLHHQTLATGFFADAGFALWKTQQFAEAVKIFIDVLEQLQQVSHPDTDLAVFVLRKRMGHTLLWLARTLRASTSPTDLLEPPPGLCSDSQYSDKFREQVNTPNDLSWLHLAQIEYHLEVGSRVFNMMRDSLLHSAIPVVRSSAVILDIQYAFRNATFDRLSVQALALATAVQLSSTHAAQGTEARESQTEQLTRDGEASVGVAFGTEVFLAALVILVSTGIWNSAFFDMWRENAKGTADEYNLMEQLNSIESVFLGSVQKATVIMSSKEENWMRRMAAALKVTAEEEVISVNDLFYAHVSLVCGLVGGTWFQTVVPHLAKLLTQQWHQRIQLPAAFILPRLTVPKIQEACGSMAIPTKKVSQILLAVAGAVSLPISTEVRNKLCTLAAEK